MNDLTPQITTVIPTYRRPQLLARAIRSVLRQTYPHFQVCVFDNASGDETADVVAEFAARDPRVKYHCHDANIGAVANFNYACSQVQTPFFNMLFDDDLLLPDFFSTVMQGFERHPDAMLSASDVVFWHPQANKVHFAKLYHWPREGYFGVPHEVPVNNIFFYPHHLGIMWRREVIDALGPIQDFYHADLDFCLRACCRFPFVVTKAPHAVFVAHEASTGLVGGFDEFWPAFARFAENMAREEQIPPQVRQKILEMLPANTEYFLSWVFVAYFRQGRFDDASRGIDLLQSVFGQRYRGRVYHWINNASRHSHWIHKFWLMVWDAHDWVDLHMGASHLIQSAYMRIAKEALQNSLSDTEFVLPRHR